MPTKVLMVAADFPPQLGGVSTYSLALARTLSEAGFEVAVVTPVPGPSGLTEGLKVTRASMCLNLKYLKIIPLTVLTFLACLRDRPDLLLLMKCNHEGVAGALARKLLGLRYVVAAYGSEVLAFKAKPLPGRFMAWLFRGAERVLVDSFYTGGLVADCGVDPERIAVVHPGFDPVPDLPADRAEALRGRLGLGGKRVMLTVSRIVRRKGHDRVVEALALLKDDYPDLVWVVAGEGRDCARLERLVASSGLGDRVRMVGRRPTEEIDLLYRMAELFVMPSRQEGIDVEGFGIAFVEAALRRIPVVAGRHGGVPEAVGDGLGGILVDPSDGREVARAIRDLLDDPTLARRLGDSGRERAIAEFGRRPQARRLRILFEDLTEGAGGTGPRARLLEASR